MVQKRAIVFACFTIVACDSAADSVDAGAPTPAASAPAVQPTAAPTASAAANAACDPSCTYSAKCIRVQMSGSDLSCCDPITKPDAKEAERCRKLEQESGGRVGGPPPGKCDTTCEYSVKCTRVQTSGSTLPCCEPIMRPDPPAADKCRKIESQGGPTGGGQ
jgi:hypothetical protein